jgi:hypothetical protein
MVTTQAAGKAAQQASVALEVASCRASAALIDGLVDESS